MHRIPAVDVTSQSGYELHGCFAIGHQLGKQEYRGLATRMYIWILSSGG